MKQSLYSVIDDIKVYIKEMMTVLEEGTENAAEYSHRLESLQVILESLQKIVPTSVYGEFAEFFASFVIFCKECRNENFLVQNVDSLWSSLELACECMNEIRTRCEQRIKKCVCCGDEVIYEPLSDYYELMKKKNGVTRESCSETLNKAEYMCPNCKCSDRDRLIVSFLEKLELDKEPAGVSLLQIAPARQIEHWINGKCMTLTYHSTDLYMSQVTFNSDIQNMEMVADETYDYFICSHVLEHVEDDEKAMRELHRILKSNGLGVFLVPLDLNREKTDEEWGLSEEENWKRFGQGDHCRAYSKCDLLDRLRRSGFYVHELGLDYFGEDVFFECGLTQTSVLYALTKEDVDIDFLINKRKENRKVAPVVEQPLISVLLPSYNHEEYIEEAIESVLNQTYKNIEFLIADDGSSDGTPQKIMQYKDRVADITLFETNTRKTFDYLTKKATGKYIALMHSDDIWMPDKLEMQVAYMESHPECAACFTGANEIYDDGRVVRSRLFRQINMNKEAWIRHFFENGNCLAHPSIMIKTQMYQWLRFETLPRTFTQLPDFWMWINLVLKEEIHIIEKELINFRFHETGDNANSSARNPENIVRTAVETQYIWYRMFHAIENKQFKEIFGVFFVNKEADIDELILCEKFFVLLNHGHGVKKQAAMFFLFDLLQLPGMEQVLEEKYQWTKLDSRRVTGEFPYGN